MKYTDTSKLEAHLRGDDHGIKPPRLVFAGIDPKLVVDKAHPWITVKKRTRQSKAAANVLKMKQTAR